jgi:flagellar basal-body rod protein FlgC
LRRRDCELRPAACGLSPENIANADSTAPRPGAEPYRRKIPTFRAEIDRALNARVVALGWVQTDPTEFRQKHELGHPAADANGNVQYPNVNSLVAMTDLKEAQRSYEANINLITASRRMTILTLVLVSSPLMLIGLGVGVAISLFQALTQIQEMTLVRAEDPRDLRRHADRAAVHGRYIAWPHGPHCGAHFGRIGGAQCRNPGGALQGDRRDHRLRHEAQAVYDPPIEPFSAGFPFEHPSRESDYYWPIRAGQTQWLLRTLATTGQLSSIAAKPARAAAASAWC